MNVTSLVRFRGRALQMGEHALEAAEQAQDELADRVLELRRSLADRIDPDPAPRLLASRLRRWLVLGGLVLALGVLAGAFAAWRNRQDGGLASSNGQHPGSDQPPADPAASSAGNGVAAEAK